jgi:hypothetical protein
MKVSTIVKTLGATLGATVLAVSTTGLPAAADPIADPNPPEDYGLYAIAGSDTTQDVINGFAETLRVDADSDGQADDRLLSSWDARPAGSLITTKDPADNANCENVVRPNGSGQGRTALRASQNDPPGSLWMGDVVIGCFDAARSSSYPEPDNPQTAGNYTYIPFGVDAVSIAKHSSSDLPDDWFLDILIDDGQGNLISQLRSIYSCDLTQVAGIDVVPLLPQSGSGTRQFWLQQMGLDEGDVAVSPCIVQTYDHDGNPATPPVQIQEHDGTALDNTPEGSILPYSVAQWIAQGNAQDIEDETGVVVENRRGNAELNTIDFEDPVTGGGQLNTLFPVVRDVYNVVPTADITGGSADPVLVDTFVGLNSLVCENDAAAGAQGREITGLFGFGFRGTGTGDLLAQECGSIALRHST